MTPKDRIEKIRAALGLLVESGGVVEVRCLKNEKGYNASGYFDDLDKAARAAAAANGKYQGVYITLNPVQPDLLARAANRIKSEKDQKTTHDAEITTRRWFPLDFDPVRPSGISSNEKERQAAHAKMQQVRKWLTGQGWPGPIEADSGNGYHLLYRIDLPNDDAARDLVKAVLEALAAKFDHETVKLDTGVFNAARIWKLYGTVAMKGDATSDRPHRTAMILDTPEALKVVSRDLLEKVSKLAPKQAESKKKTEEKKTYADETPDQKLAKARKALDALHSSRRDDYHQWLKVGMALTELGEQGLSLWDSWSAQSSRYTQGSCAAKWKTFTSGKVGLATLYKFANEDRPDWNEEFRPKANHAASNGKPVALQNTQNIELTAILADLARAQTETEKLAAIKTNVPLAATLQGIDYDVVAKKLKEAGKAIGVNSVTIDDQLRQARAEKQKPLGEGNPGYFYEKDGEIWCGHGTQARPVTIGGIARWAENVQVDDGGKPEKVMTLEIKLKSGKTMTAKMPGKDTANEKALLGVIRECVGSRLTVPSAILKQLPQAIDEISNGSLRDTVELARTGWIETENGLVYATPGGQVGELPEDWRMGLPDDFDRFAVSDNGDKAFRQGLDGLVNGFLLEAFPSDVSYPATMFALLPVAARWFPGHQKFWMHFSGETGSNKTTAAQGLMALYGAKFAHTPPLANFRSTINSVERMGWFLPDTLGLIDDYKPSLLKPREFYDAVHRQCDQADRTRMNVRAELMARKPPRWWVMSTGEDVPTGESSVMARMIVLRFGRRPASTPYNEGLGKFIRLSKHLPTVTARWARYLIAHGGDLDIAARLELHHQVVAAHIMGTIAGTPNANRIARNIAVLWVMWDIFTDWLAVEAPWVTKGLNADFSAIAMRLADAQSAAAIGQKPVTVFLETIQEKIDDGTFELLPTSEASTTLLKTVAGWYDGSGIYLLPSIYDKIAELKFKAQQQIGFTRAELYRLLREEGTLARWGKADTTVTIRVGNPPKKRSKRVLHLKSGALQVDGDE